MKPSSPRKIPHNRKRGTAAPAQTGIWHGIATDPSMGAAPAQAGALAFLASAMKRGIGQSGAMFGLDARIALGIFGVLSLVAGAAMVLSIDSTRAKSLATELSETGRAIEGIHEDLRTDIFLALQNPSEKNAFAALFDNQLITEERNLRGRWLGPYITFTSASHPRYGEMVIQKRGNKHTDACATEAGCNLWLVYSSVKPGIVDEVDTIIDGGKEEQPNLQGRIQWTADSEAHILFYNVAKALTYTTD